MTKRKDPQHKTLTPRQFANILHRAMQLREASWFNSVDCAIDGVSVDIKVVPKYAGYYKLTIRQAVEKTCPVEWQEPIHLLLYTGFGELWDWCATTRKRGRANHEKHLTADERATRRFVGARS